MPHDACYEPLLQRACELAMRGEGFVEPNPMVGCVVAQQGNGDAWQIIGEGWHERFGGPHAEVNALAAAGKSAQGATLFVTLEPCCHTGKTPPCTDAIIAAGVRRVVVGHTDPFSQVAGGGIAALESAGIEVVLGQDKKIKKRLAPYLMLTEQKRPWVLAKWAMTLDGKIATSTGDSRWISGEASRAVVHKLRGRMDGVLIGAGTLVADDPLLTARPPGPRTPVRIVVAGDRPLPLEAKLFASVDLGPVMVYTGKNFPADNAEGLTERGVEVLSTSDGIRGLLDELGKRQLTNVLVEGGSRLLGELFDAQLVDEAHVFIAPKLLGGTDAPSPIAGEGFTKMADASELMDPQSERLGEDVHVWGHLRRFS